ncbi:D-alanyl-D-alanine carboxypeptidase-like protein [Sediminihabitans luteus]|uniref:D-alanyl-D-alanine carboxypeptidase-like protein n=1 Tax=Sediminihabitans luteus TaxID=1138585 RepID=A0A2M9CZY1_9CELL|nr:M15 family metallopeptidase [Sediminihabitans luteus]PJJ77501.1 D-alanyl-D-alanine carboxypeptidase-like protein [Sediminihabitans luteus]GII98398.1 hypothetical protein Slu03_07760 [Sediminihabitans luteus]
MTTKTFAGIAYANGAVPAALLAPVPGQSSATLRLDAAAALGRLLDEHERRYGKRLVLRGWSRSLAEQKKFFLERYTRSWTARGDVRWYKGLRYVRTSGAAAAIPGTSNHGWGLAIDVADFGGVGDFTHPDRVRFAELAGRYGWTDAEGRSISEPWHWVYEPTLDTSNRPRRARTVRIPAVTKRAWQRQLGVADDGDLGTNSWAAVQRRINDLNVKGRFLRKGPLKVDGVYGDRTQQALISALNYAHRIGRVKYAQGYLDPDVDRFGYRRLGALRQTLHAGFWS